MAIRHVLGIDPGPTTGMCLVAWQTDTGQVLDVNVLQTDDRIASVVADALIRFVDTRLHIAVEQFVVGRGSMRAGSSGQRTRDLVGRLQSLASFRRVPADQVHMQTAAQVKPWATDARLDACGLLEATKGMRHARDAARHALFAAVRHRDIPDPLSKKGRNR